MPESTSMSQTVALLQEHHLPARRDLLIDVAQDIHAHPEIRFEERHACARLTAELEAAGFTVERGYAGLETAFVARWSTPEAGDEAPTLAVFCEYDALEGIGHGCGHNIIAAAGLGGGLLAKDVLERGDRGQAHLMVVGSPAEEGAAGKVPMVEAGVLTGVDAAMMVHPSGYDEPSFSAMARVAFDVTFHGRASHAAGSPDDGINALDAATLSLTAIGLLRQQTRDGSRIHAIVTDGGQAPNIIPESAGLRVFVRSLDTAYLEEELAPRVRRCFEGAALATGCTVDVAENTPPYSTMRNNPVLHDLVLEGFEALGRTHSVNGSFGGSTDMGNVSQVVPSMHPMLELVPEISNHTREFTVAAVGPDADRATTDGAVLLAATVLTLVDDTGRLAEVRRRFDAGE